MKDKRDVNFDLLIPFHSAGIEDKTPLRRRKTKILRRMHNISLTMDVEFHRILHDRAWNH